MSIAPQPAMRAESNSTRPLLARSPHDLVAVRYPPRAWTMCKLAGLVFLTAAGVALATAMVFGFALFTVLNFG